MQKEKIKLVYLITGLGIGGAEKVVFDLSKYINKSYFDIHVISISKHQEMLSKFLDAGIKVTVLKKNNTFKDFIEIIYDLNKYIKKNNIDIVHAHMAHSIIVISIVKLLNPKLKLVFTSHSINMESKIREFILFLLRPLRMVDILFSKEQRKYFYSKNIEIIPNGIEILQKNLIYRSSKYEKFIFLAVGRIEYEKNHKFIIQIVEKIPESLSYEIWIVGEGSLKKELESLVYLKGLTNKIKFLGLRKDIPLLLEQANCFIMTSLWEGLPISLLEAGVSELPIISTPVGSIPTVLDSSNACLSSFDNFHIHMQYIMKDYKLALSKAKRLKEKLILLYDMNLIVLKHENLYKKLFKGYEC